MDYIGSKPPGKLGKDSNTLQAAFEGGKEKLENILDVLKWRYKQRPENSTYVYLIDGEVEDVHCTTRMVYERAVSIAHAIQEFGITYSKRGTMVMLYPLEGYEFIYAFFGAVFSGGIPVPVYPPDPTRLKRSLTRFNRILEDCECKLILATRELKEYFLSNVKLCPELSKYPIICTDEVKTCSEKLWIEPSFKREDIAFLQYTSGSTGDPKGVMVTHESLMVNERMIYAMFEPNDDPDPAIRVNNTTVSWLPSYHDMGLIGIIIHAPFTGCTAYIMSPLDFLKKPLNWLRALSKYKCPGTVAPNFACELCIRRCPPEERDKLDLSNIKIWLSGAEPIRAESLERFAHYFEPCGFSRECYFPVYGLAEATLMVTGGWREQKARISNFYNEQLERGVVEEALIASDKTRCLVSCGFNRTLSKLAIVIVDDEKGIYREAEAGKVGEIWISGKCITKGYWKREELTKETFQAKLEGYEDINFMRTGDLGFLRYGELFVCGRAKDLIIFHGRNYYPQDIEFAVERAHPMLRPGNVAAFSIEIENEEKLVIAQEVTTEFEMKYSREAVLAIKESAMKEIQVPVYSVALCKPQGIFKTSSGKIQRRACKAAYLEKRLDAVFIWREGTDDILSSKATTTKVSQINKAVKKTSSTSNILGPMLEKSLEIQQWLLEKVAERKGVAIMDIDPTDNFTSYGLDSSEAVSLSGDLEEYLKVKLRPTLAYEYPSIELLARYLGGEDVKPVTGEDDFENVHAEPIALVGLACRFPGAVGIEEFWQMLMDNTDAISEVPTERYDVDLFYNPTAGTPNKMNIREGGYISDFDKFDNKFFNITSAEAKAMDPQQRQLLEVAIDAINDAGFKMEDLVRSRTGVYVGMSQNEYGAMMLSSSNISNPFIGTGAAFSIASNRLSYLLDLQGPSLTVDTACSSSLVAIDIAAKHIQSGVVDTAIVAGVNLLLTPATTIALAQSGFLSNDGRCKPFDSHANGFTRSEGIGVVVMKNYMKSLEDQDRVYAVLRSSVVNQDGKSNGLTAPNPISQQIMLREAYGRAGIPLTDVQYIECHGTGTALGDPIEVDSIAAVFSEERKRKLLIGSLKSNIGHMESAAGIGGIVKLALSVYNERIPASIHYQIPNPEIDFERYPIEVVAPSSREWKSNGSGHLIGGVSSFGFGGTNSHVVLQNSPKLNLTPPKSDDETYNILLLTAQTRHSLKETAEQYKEFLTEKCQDCSDEDAEKDPDRLELEDVCTQLAKRRTHHKHRLGIIGLSIEEMVDDIDSYLEQKDEVFLNSVTENSVYSEARRGSKKVCFVFGGQGPQWYAMGRDFLLTEKEMRRLLEKEANDLFKGDLELDWSFRKELTCMKESQSQMNETKVAQIILYLLGVAVTGLWEKYGLKPDCVIGHSLGEIAAANVSGALTMEECCKIVRHRAYLMQRQHGNGKMISISCTVEELEVFVEKYKSDVSIAVENSTKFVVLSGKVEPLEQCVAEIKEKYPDRKYKYLPVNYAFHSPLLDDTVKELEGKIGSLNPQKSSIPIYSTKLGKRITGEELDAKYWGEQVREMVHFRDALIAAINDGVTHFVEISPHPILSLYIESMLEEMGKTGVVVPTMVRDEAIDDLLVIRKSFTTLWASGLDLDFSKFMVGTNFVELPRYKWEHHRFWMEGMPSLGKKKEIDMPEKSFYRLQWQALDMRLRRHFKRSGRPLIFSHEPNLFSGDEMSEAITITRLPEAENGKPEQRTRIIDENTATCSTSVASFEFILNTYKGDISTIVYCWNLPELDSKNSEEDKELNPNEEISFFAPLNLLKAMVRCKITSHVRLCFLTSGTQRIHESDKSNDLSQTLIWSIAGVAHQEYPELHVLCADVSSSVTEAELEGVYREVISATMEDEVAFRGKSRYVRRLRRLVVPKMSDWSHREMDPEAAYLIAGGFGGFGIEVAKRIVELGARRVYLLSRRGLASEEVEAVLELLRSEGAEIVGVKCDISNYEEVKSVVSSIKNVKGIFHAAGMYDRGLLITLEREHVEDVMKSKIAGSINLHKATLDVELDFFVFFSSMCALVHSEGEASYAAGNIFQNALAEHRKAKGLPAIAINWGILADVGMITQFTLDNQKEIDALQLVQTQKGLKLLTPMECMKGLSYILTRNDVQVGLMKVNWSLWNLGQKLPPRLEDFSVGDEEVKKIEHSENEIKEWLVVKFAEVAELKPEEVDVDLPLGEAGLDSMVVISLATELGGFVGKRISPTMIYDFPTISALAKHLSEGDVEIVSEEDDQVFEREEIAIVGIGCRLPGHVNDVEDYWELLTGSKDGIEIVPKERFDVDRFFDPQPELRKNKISSKYGGFMDNIDEFDAGFFRISPREAERMDPQQRVLLEVSWEALEDAGIKPSKLSHGKHGVFIGVSVSDYVQLQASEFDINDAYVSTGGSLCMCANRLSFFYDLRGPSMTVDSACSSSLSAIHLGCQAIRNGEAEVVIAGGVNAVLTPGPAITLSQTGALSPDGHCYTFDSRANGYVRSEGCGIIVLKRLKQAIHDNDRIYATVKGSRLNQDGRSSGLTVPNGQSQRELIKDIYRKSGESLENLDYLECHGTGTNLGDPIEVENFGQLVSKYRKMEDPVIIGSVKSNIGHTESASGAASVIKVALMLQNETIVPSIHYETPNPYIHFDELPLEVSRKTEEWPKNGEKDAIAGVSSFGFGGTNGHVILKGFRQSFEPSNKDADFYFLPISGQSEKSLFENARRLHGFVKSMEDLNLHDLCYNLWCNREHHRVRSTIVFSNRENLLQALDVFPRALAVQSGAAIQYHKPQDTKAKTRTAFVFSGQGSQEWAMGRELYESNIAFREAIQRIDSEFRKLEGGESPFSIVEEMTMAEEKNSRHRETLIAQPMIFALQVGYVEAFKSLDIQPSCVLGHSLGEIAAFYAAGLFSLEDACKIVFYRSKVMQKASRLGGRMCAVGVSLDRAKEFIVGLEENLAVSAHNGRDSAVFSGGEKEVAEAVERLKKAEPKCFTRYLDVDFAFHSPQMAPFSEELAGNLEGITPLADASIPVYSTLFGRKVEDISEINAEYFSRQIKEPVLFYPALVDILDSGYSVFVEITPHPAVLFNINETIREKSGDISTENQAIAVAVRRRAKPGSSENMHFYSSLGTFYCRTVSAAWEKLYADGSFLRLPTYAWDRQRYWYKEESSHYFDYVDAFRRTGFSGFTEVAKPKRDLFPLLKKTIGLTGGLKAWETDITPDSDLSWEYEHKGFDTVLVPGVTYIEAGLEVSALMYGTKPLMAKERHIITDINFLSPLFLTESHYTATLQTTLAPISPYEAQVKVSSIRKSEDGNMSDSTDATLHATMKIHAEQDSWIDVCEAVRVDKIIERCPFVVEGSRYYSEMRERGLDLGIVFRGIHRIHVGENEVIAEQRLPIVLANIADNYVFFPSFIDAQLQVIGATVLSNSDLFAKINGVFLPTFIEMIQMLKKPPRKLYTHVKVVKLSARALIGDINVLDEDGDAVMYIKGFRCNYTEDPRQHQQQFFGMNWVERPLSTTDVSADAKRCVVVALAQEVLTDGLVAELGKNNVSVPLIISRSSKTTQPKDGKCSVSYEDISSDHGVSVLQDALKSVKDDIGGLICLMDSSRKNGSLVDLTSGPVVSALNVTKAVVAEGSNLRLCFATVNAQHMETLESLEDEAVFLSPVWGLGEVIATEYPSTGIKMVDITSDGSDVAALAAEFSRELAKDPFGEGVDDMVAYRKAKRFARVVEPVAKKDPHDIVSLNSSETPYRLEITRPGVLDSLLLRKIDRVKPPRYHLEVKVKSAGINFRDVMKALGLYPAESDDSSVIGLEACGEVVRVGKGVSNFKIGDEVICIADAAFGSHITAHEAFVVKKPSGWTHMDGASTIGVLMTSYLSLVKVANIKEGERVLIHSATGGVGIAAIQICKKYKCEMFLTVGREEKVDYLVKEFDIPRSHIFNSRTLSFADSIMSLTNNEGVDIVLNSLYGEGLRRSLECLGHRGRFVEIGKIDIYQNSLIGLRYLRKNVSISHVAIDEVFKESPEYASELLKEVIGHCEGGDRYKPIPHTAFHISEGGKAFRYMALAKHIGKVILTVDDEKVDVLRSSLKTAGIRSDSTYLITGGLGGFGFSVALWLAQSGAKHIILCSRSGVVKDSWHSIGDIERLKVEVAVVKCDVANYDDLKSSLANTMEKLPPLRGIFHCAGVLDDKFIPDMGTDSMVSVLQAKVAGGWNLHRISEGMEIEHFVLFSSIASILGNAGQANYAAANYFLDTLSELRHAHGLPATSINWGPIENVGMFARLSEGLQKAAVAQGLEALSTRRANNLLTDILQNYEERANIIATRIDWSKWKTMLHSVPGRFAEILRSQESYEMNEYLRGLIALPSDEEREDKIRTKILEEITKVIGLEKEKIEVNRPLNELGFDSMVAIELRSKLEDEVGLTIPIAVLIQGPSVSDLLEVLMDQLRKVSAERGMNLEEQQKQVEYNESLDIICVRDVPGSEKEPLFLVTPAGGVHTIFAPLIEKLESNRSIYVLQSMKEYTSLKEMASSYANIIKAAWKGRYVVVGHSLGAVVAYETVNKLISEGEVVDQLVMVEPISPKISEHIEGMNLEILAMGLFARNQKRIFSLVDVNEDGKKLELLDLVDYEEEERWAKFLDLCGYTTPQEETYARIFVGRIVNELRILNEYTSSEEILKGEESVGTCKIVFVYAENNDEDVVSMLSLEDVRTEWASVIQGSTVSTVRGDHWTILEEPNVELLADLLNKIIK